METLNLQRYIVNLHPFIKRRCHFWIRARMIDAKVLALRSPEVMENMRGANGVGKLNQHARPKPAVKRGLVDLVDKNNQLFVPDRATAPAAPCGLANL